MARSLMPLRISRAVRDIRNAPGLSAAVILMLSVGIGLATTYFSLVNGAFFRPLPYRSEDRIVRLLAADELDARTALLASRSILDAVGGFEVRQSVAAGDRGLREVTTTFVDSGVFRVLGTEPMLGSLPSPAAIAADSGIAVISQRFWTSEFGQRPDIIGHFATVHGRRRQIRAVMPAHFTFPENTDAWLPLSLGTKPRRAIGLLRLGESADRLKEALAAGTSNESYRPIQILPGVIERGSDNPRIRSLVWLILGSAIGVLLIGCVNVATLTLASGERKRPSLLIRSALGATRWELIRQELTSASLLACAGMAVGCLLSIAGVRVMVSMIPDAGRLPGWVSFSLDWRVIGFACIAAFLTVLVFGLWPAIETTRLNLSQGIRSFASNAMVGFDPTQKARVPILLSIALSVGLMGGAANALISIHLLHSANRGYRVDGVTRVWIGGGRLPGATPEDEAAWHEAYVTRLQAALPGATVALAGPVRYRELAVFTDSSGRPAVGAVDGWQGPTAVSPNYFEILRIPVISGRGFTQSDSGSSDIVGIVSMAFARLAWGEDSPIGKRLHASGTNVRVVGVVGDILEPARSRKLALVAVPKLYLSYRQVYSDAVETIVRSAEGVEEIRRQADQVAKAAGREMPVQAISLQALEDARAALPRIVARILLVFATCGMVLAMVGVFGIVSTRIARRSKEIAVRVALGGRPLDVVRAMLGESTRLTLFGTAIGLTVAALMAIGISRVLATSISVAMLTAIGSACAFGLAATVAAAAPAGRAALRSPASVLRDLP